MTNAANTLTRAAITLERKPLADALKVLCKVVEKRNTIPIVSTLRLDVDASGAVQMIGTDLDLELSYALTGEDAAAGSFLVDCHALAKTLAKMKGGRVRIADGGDVVTLSDVTNGATLRLTNLCERDAISEYPRTKGAEREGMTLPAGQLREDFGRCLAAVSFEETRYYLNGIYCHLTTGDDAAPVLRMATTDGHRLVRVTRPVPGDIGDNLAQGKDGAILPRKAAGLVLDIIGNKPAGLVALAFDRTRFTFAHGAVTMTGKLIDGTFPDYPRCIPSDHKRGVNIDRAALADAVSAVTAHCKDKLACVTIGAAAAGWFTAAGCDADSGIAGVELRGVQVLAPVDGNGSTEIETGMGKKYVLDMTGKVFPDADTLEIRFQDTAAPVLFRCDALPHVLAVQMPKRGAAALDPAGVRALNPAAAAPEPVATPEHADDAAAATDAAPVDVSAPGDVLSRVPEPIAANDDAAAPIDPVAEHDAAAIAALAPLPAEELRTHSPAVHAVWFAYVAGIVGSGAAGWDIETGRKQADRKARNRGKVLISHDLFVSMRDRFNELAPFQAAAAPVDSPALPCRAETVTPEPVAVPCPPVAAAAPVQDVDAIAALSARLQVLERAAGITTARPPRTAAHVRAIRAYLKMRAERAAARADAVQARTNETAVRASVQVQARDLMRLEETVEALRDGITTAECEAARLTKDRASLETIAAGLDTELRDVRAALAALQVTAAADRAELERLAPVVSALAALNRPALAIAA